MSSDRRVLKRISPIQMKSGRAVRVQEEDADQMVVIMASPTGREVNSSMPTKATPRRARPTQTPVPSSRKRTNRKMAISSKLFHDRPLLVVFNDFRIDAVFAGEDQIDKMIGQKRSRRPMAPGDHR